MITSTSYCMSPTVANMCSINKCQGAGSMNLARLLPGRPRSAMTLVRSCRSARLPALQESAARTCIRYLVIDRDREPSPVG